MTEGAVQYLWSERISPVEPTDLLRLEEPLNLRFFGINRADEAIVGHRVLRRIADDATILQVRRDFDTPGAFYVDLVSSLEDEYADAWESLHTLVLEQLRRVAVTNQGDSFFAEPDGRDSPDYQPSDVDQRNTGVAARITRTPVNSGRRSQVFVLTVGALGVGLSTLVGILDNRLPVVLLAVGSASVVAIVTALVIANLTRPASTREYNLAGATSSTALRRRRKNVGPVEALMRALEIEAQRDGAIAAHGDRLSTFREASHQMDFVIRSWQDYWHESVIRNFSAEKLKPARIASARSHELEVVDGKIDRSDSAISAALKVAAREAEIDTPLVEQVYIAPSRWTERATSALIYVSACVVEIALNYLAFQLMGQGRLETFILAASVVLVNVLLPKQLGDLLAQRSFALGTPDRRRWNTIKLVAGLLFWMASSLFVAIVRSAYLLYQGGTDETLVRQAGLDNLELTLGWLSVALAVGLVVLFRSAYTYDPTGRVLRRAGTQVKRATAQREREVVRRSRVLSDIEIARADLTALGERESAALRSSEALASELAAHYRRHLLRAIEAPSRAGTESLIDSSANAMDAEAMTSLAHKISFDGGSL